MKPNKSIVWRARYRLPDWSCGFRDIRKTGGQTPIDEETATLGAQIHRKGDEQLLCVEPLPSLSLFDNLLCLKK